MAATPANTQAEEMKIKLWGVRGSTPTPGPRQQRYGGNTACMQVLGTGDEVCIFDAGSGIRALGMELAALKTVPSRVHIFLTHFHWDHIQGVPYFEPIYDPRFHVVFHAAHPAEETRRILSAQMQPPYFPCRWKGIRSGSNSMSWAKGRRRSPAWASKDFRCTIRRAPSAIASRPPDAP